MNQIDRPLVEALQKFSGKNPVSFHVPGHKNGLLSGLPSEIGAALQFDVTELEGLDDLHEPAGVIKEAQDKLANLYGTTKSYFLVNGSTVGNLAMIYATCASGDTVIVQRNAHKSVMNGIELVGATPVFLAPTWDERTQTAGTIDVDLIEKALQRYPHAKAVILTYPTYYGSVGEGLKEIVSRCHASGIPVLVDEAHGAHFVIGKPFPVSALDAGADIVVQSAHKTLPAMTMGSFLHASSDLIDSEKVSHYLQMLQSSSPSYVLMASLDDARAYAEAYNERDIDYFMQQRAIFLKRLKEIPQLDVVEVDDPLKLILRVAGYSGFAIQRQLEMESVFPELADPFQVLLVLPLVREGVQFPFQTAIQSIALGVNRLLDNPRSTSPIANPPVALEKITALIYPSASLQNRKKEWIDFDSAVGCVAAASVIPYPPGIPLVIAGERILKEHVEALHRLTTMGARFQGTIRVDERQVWVVKQLMEE